MTPYYTDELVTIYHGDCREVMADLVDESIDLVLTDPPYPSEFQWCWPLLASESFRLLKDQRNVITLLGHYQLPFVLESFASVPLRYWWICGMQHTHATKLHGKDVAIYWKPALWFVKSKRRSDIPDMPCDMVANVRPSKADHPWEQGQSWFGHYVDRLSLEGETVLDPFMGTGTTLAAARWWNRRAIGIEIEERHCATAAARLSQRSLMDQFVFSSTAVE